jgi:hypothetical protein
MIDASPIAAVLSDPRQPDNPIWQAKNSGYRTAKNAFLKCPLLVAVSTGGRNTLSLKEKME